MKNNPIFYPSVSSVAKNRLAVLDHIEILVALNHPHFLISAYDIFHLNKSEKETFKQIQQKLIDNKIDIIVDSGMYEKVWAQDDEWCYDHYKETIDLLSYNFVFNYDKYINPANMPSQQIIDSMNKSTIKNLSPIIHTKNIEDLPNLCLEVAKLENVNCIAIPERELGYGVLEGIRTVSKIKKLFNKQGCNKKIHILGTGNPISILMYSAFGINSFDGLDWCQTVVDYGSATLHHSLQLDFFAHQSKLGANKDIGYNTRLLAHNLEFYLLWMEEISREINNNSMVDMLKFYLPKSIEKEVVKLYESYN